MQWNIFPWNTLLQKNLQVWLVHAQNALQMCLSNSPHLTNKYYCCLGKLPRVAVCMEPRVWTTDNWNGTEYFLIIAWGACLPQTQNITRLILYSACCEATILYKHCNGFWKWPGCLSWVCPWKQWCNQSDLLLGQAFRIPSEMMFLSILNKVDGLPVIPISWYAYQFW